MYFSTLAPVTEPSRLKSIDLVVNVSNTNVPLTPRTFRGISLLSLDQPLPFPFARMSDMSAVCWVSAQRP